MVALAIAVGVLGVPALPVHAAVVAPGTVNNPTLPARCGLKVVLVVDSSGSIGANAPQVTGAVGTFLDTLIGTGSDVGLVDFDTQVNSTIPFTPMTTSSRAGVFQKYLDSYKAGGGTNWAMALNTSRSMSAASTTATGRKTDLVLFVTDGRPTYRGGYTPPSGPPPIALTDDGDGSQTSAQERIEAANRADEIKNLGTHIFLVGVGSALANPPAGDLQSIRAVTGNQQFPTVTTDFGAADYSLIANFNQLATALRDLVFAVCSTSVTVTKQVDTGGVITPGNGYGITGTVQSVGGGNNPFEWQLPAAGPQVAPNSQTQTTAGAGTASFQWTPGSVAAPLAQTSTFSFVESGVPPGSVFATASCTIRLPDGTSTTSPYVLGNLITVARGSLVACTVTNKRVSTITLQKQWSNALADDTAAITASFPGGAPVSATSTAAGGSQLDASLASIVVPVGNTLHLSEVLTGTAYSVTLVCNGVVIPTTQDVSTYSGDYLVPDKPNIDCRFGNSRNQTTLILDKVWGIDATTGDTVLLTLTPPSGLPVTVSNTVGGAGQAGPLLVLVGDTIALSEAFTVGSPSGYTSNLTCSSAGLTYTPGNLSGSLVVGAADAGKTITCRFTNDPLQALVALSKTLDPSIDPGRFDLTVTNGVASDTFPGAADGDSTEPISVNVGTTVTLSEVAALDTVAANYSSTLDCGPLVSLVGNTFVVTPALSGERISCAFTNTRQRAQLLITKQWGGPVDPTQSVVAGATSGQDLNGKLFVHDGTVPTPFVIDVVVGETVRLGERFEQAAAANYAKDLQCGTVTVPIEAPVLGDDDSPTSGFVGARQDLVLDFDANFEIPVSAAGGQVLCTFINTRNSGTLTLQKSWTAATPGDSALLSINGLVDNSATATATGAAGTETSPTVATASIYAGEVVTLSEIVTAAGG